MGRPLTPSCSLPPHFDLRHISDNNPGAEQRFWALQVEPLAGEGWSCSWGWKYDWGELGFGLELGRVVLGVEVEICIGANWSGVGRVGIGVEISPGEGWG